LLLITGYLGPAKKGLLGSHIASTSIASGEFLLFSRRVVIQNARLGPPIASMDSSSAAETLQYVLWLVWTFLVATSTKIKHPIYAAILSTLDAVEKLAADSLLAFAPHLLEVLQSGTPPSDKFFKGLPTNGKYLWGVYFIVMEKKGCLPRIYIDCSTALTGGLYARFGQYGRTHNLSQYVKRALAEGFTITHMEILCSCPIRTASHLHVKVLILALEAALTAAFWAMNNRSKTYGVPSLCDWSRDSFEYDGLCSHSALVEGVSGKDEGLTGEALEAAETALHQRRQEAKKRYSQAETQRQNDFKLNDFAAFNAARRTYWLNGNPELRAASKKRCYTKAIDSKRFFCSICNVTTATSTDLKIHKATQKHINKAAGVPKVSKAKNQRDVAYHAANIAARRFCCDICDGVFVTQAMLNRHVNTKKHIDNATAAASKSSSARLT